MKKFPVALLLVFAAALTLAACGGSSSTSEATSETAPKESTSEGKEEAEGGEEEGGSAAASTLKIETASTGLAYASDTATAEAGNVTVDFSNGQSVPHDVAIETMNGEVLGETETIAEGEDSTEIELKPGTYKFFCTVPGHREAGMEGTLTVK
ncbi:MAG TPA: plastocyanin/azurin family copper-binding protein [Solirubrobacterales bacterium]|nr:plastocyanin/azurin family copper-binding protein [Solirubrobacterales bacterium]